MNILVLLPHRRAGVSRGGGGSQRREGMDGNGWMDLTLSFLNTESTSQIWGLREGNANEGREGTQHTTQQRGVCIPCSLSHLVSLSKLFVGLCMQILPLFVVVVESWCISSGVGCTRVQPLCACPSARIIKRMPDGFQLFVSCQ